MKLNKQVFAGVFFISVIFMSFKMNAQDYYLGPRTTEPARVKPNAPDSLPKIYLGLGTGVNNYSGILGIGADVRLYKPLFLRLGLGIGEWGTKFTIGLKYEENKTNMWSSNGWAYGISYSTCSGLSNFKSTLPTDSAGITTTKSVTMNLNQANNLNLTASYNWHFRKHKNTKFYLEFGYAIRMQTTPYTITDGSVLTNVGTEAMKLVSPGGFIFDFGFLFGL